MKQRILVLALVILAVLSACTPEKPPETTPPPETTLPAETTAPAETEPQLPDGAYPPGEYTVGKDIPAGEYVFLPNEPEQAAAAHIKRNGESAFFCETVGQIFATAQDGDTLIAKNSYFLSAEGYIAQPDADGVYSPGMYRVGIDIPPEEYQITRAAPEGAGCWSRLFTYSQDQQFVDASPYNVVNETPVFADLSTSTAYALILGANTRATVALPPENATFLLPEAPEEAEVTPLPDSYDAADLVSPYWETGAVFASGNTYSIFLPEIYPFSEDAVAVQQEIYRMFYDELHWLVRHSVQYPVTESPDISEITIHADSGTYLGYSAGIREGILSVAIRIDDPNASAARKYSVYNFDLATGALLDSRTVADRINIPREIITQRITEYYEEMHAVLPDKTVDFYQENLKKTLSEENLAAGQVCIGEDGSVGLIVDIYSMGSLESVQRFVTITE